MLTLQTALNPNGLKELPYLGFLGGNFKSFGLFSYLFSGIIKSGLTH